MSFLYNKEANTVDLTIRQLPPNRFSAVMLLLLAIISTVIPIVVLFVFGIGKTSLLSIVLFCGSGIYLSRLYLWNTHGVEFLNISKKEIVHTLDYALFKDVTQIINKGIIFQVYSADAAGKRNGSNLENILDDQQRLQKDYLKIVFSNRENQVIEINGKLPAEYVKIIGGMVNVLNE